MTYFRRCRSALGNVFGLASSVVCRAKPFNDRIGIVLGVPKRDPRSAKCHKGGLSGLTGDWKSFNVIEHPVLIMTGADEI